MSKFDGMVGRPGKTKAPTPRPRAKSKNPDYCKFITYVPKTMHRAIKIACLTQEPPIDMSDLVEQQLAAWLKKHA